MYGVLASFGIGLVYNIAIPVVSAWFPINRGSPRAFASWGSARRFSLGPLATGALRQRFWRVVIGCLGVVFAASTVASSFVIRAPRLDEIGLPEPVAGPARDAGAGEGECHGLLSSPVFYLEFLFLFFMGSNGMGITGIGRELPLTLGVDDMAAAFIIGFVNIGSGIGRFGGGVLLDRIGCERSMLGIAVMGVASPAIVAASLAMGSVALQLAGCLLFGVSWGAAIVTMPFITRREWGQADLAQNMAVVNTYSIFGALAGSFGAGLLIEATGSFYPVLGVMVVFALGALLVACGMARLRASIRVPSLG